MTPEEYIIRRAELKKEEKTMSDQLSCMDDLIETKAVQCVNIGGRSLRGSGSYLQPRVMCDHKSPMVLMIRTMAAGELARIRSDIESLDDDFRRCE